MSDYIVGLTGGIGSGKTFVSDMFAQLYIDVVDADVVARQVVEPGTTALKAIEQHFGRDFINIDLQLNRKKLREKIFSDPKEKAWLNNLLHPLIRDEISKQLSHAKSPYCILVAPLLLENNLHNIVNRVLVVDTDESTQVARTVSRDETSAEQVNAIIASQISREQRLSKADDIINNNQMTVLEVKQQVLNLHEQFLLQAEQHLTNKK